MTPVVSLPGIAKLAYLIGDAVKHVASKVDFANAFRQVNQVGGQTPGAPRLVRLHSLDEGRIVLTMESGDDPSLAQRLESLERAAARRPSSQQGVPASGTSTPPDDADMVVHKAKYSSTNHETTSTTSLPTAVAGLYAMEPQKSWLHDHFVPYRNVSSEASPAEPVSAKLAMGSHSGKWTAFVDALRRIFVSSPNSPIEKFRFPGEAASHGRWGSDRSQASTHRTSLSSLGEDSVFGELKAPVASELAHGVFEAASNKSTSSSSSSIGRALRWIFSVPELTPGEKLHKIKVELRQIHDWYSPLDRGDRAKQLLDQVSAKLDSDGESAAYAYAKEHIGGVRKAGMSTSRQFYEHYGPSRTRACTI